MSNLSDKIKDLLKSALPHYKIDEEHYVMYQGQKLYFDFFIKDFNLLIEVQGEQHYTFSEHFHSSRENFMAYKRRDRMKVDYVEESGILLLVIDEPAVKIMTKAKLVKAIGKVQKEGYLRK